MAKKLYTHQQIRKTIKRDELREGLDKLIHYARTNTENLLIAAIIAVVVAILIPLYFRHQAGNELRAAGLLDRANAYSQQPVDSTLGALGRGFKDQDEKVKKTQEAYAEVVNTYKGTQAARLAAMGQANTLFWAKQYEPAAAAFTALLAQHPKDFWTASLRERLGACQENLKQWANAKATYEALLAQSPDYFDRRAVRIALARCQHELGQTAEAAKLLAEEQKEDPGSFWAEQARMTAALLGQKPRD